MSPAWHTCPAAAVPAEGCPATDGRAAFELAGMYDSRGFEDEAGAEYERALEAQIDTLPRYQRSMRRFAAALTESADSGEPTAQ